MNSRSLWRSKTVEFTENVCKRYGWSYMYTTSYVPTLSSTTTCTTSANTPALIGEQHPTSSITDHHQTNQSTYKIDSSINNKNASLKLVCTVCVGIKDQRHFISEGLYPNSTSGLKNGIEDVTQVAQEGLIEIIENEKKKPLTDLSDVFTNKINVYESHPMNWNYFWNNRPEVVGIDVEGNKKSPPVLIQISTDSYTIFDYSLNGKISDNVRMLLNDDTIVKVFCDSKAQQDKKALGLLRPNDKWCCTFQNYLTGPIVDLEVLGRELLGPTISERGICKLVSLSMPELEVRIHKGERQKDIKRFVSIENGSSPRLQSMYNLSEKEQQYAALDSWCNLQVYKRFMKHLSPLAEG